MRLYFFLIFYIRIIHSRTNISSIFWELKNVDFWAVTRQAAFFQKGIAPLIFIQSGSTKAQMNRLDENYWLNQVKIQYPENWIFFLRSPFSMILVLWHDFLIGRWHFKILKKCLLCILRYALHRTSCPISIFEKRYQFPTHYSRSHVLNTLAWCVFFLTKTVFS